MELGRCEVGDVVVDGDLDDALGGHDGRGARVVRRRRDGARVPVPLRVLTSDQSQAKPRTCYARAGLGLGYKKGTRKEGDWERHAL